MNRFLTFFLLLAAVACTENETARRQDKASSEHSDLVGTWVLTEQKVSIGGPATWSAVDQGDTVRLNDDGSFIWPNLDCSPKLYERQDDLIQLSYDCPEDSEYADYAGHVNDFNHRIVSLTASSLTVTPATVMCTEECLYKYTRVDDDTRR